MLVERILSEQGVLEAQAPSAGERKTITALFADIAGSTALIYDRDPEDAHRLITPIINLMMEAVHHYEGYVAKSLGDGILALFGAPLANEDHPLRALYAALRMQASMRSHAARLRTQRDTVWRIRVGIHTGEVVVRSIRKDDLRADYDPVGHTIHIASRLETMAAPSSILVSESTYKLAEGYFEFKALGSTLLKGIPEPLAIYELLGVGALRTRLQVAAQRGLAHFVGREFELKALHRALEEVVAGHGKIVAVEGEAGIGKSRLFLEFKEHARDCLVLETFSVSHGKSFAYLPLIELLKNYFQITVRDEETRCREKISVQILALDHGLHDALPYLLYLLGVSEPHPALADMDPRIRRDRIFKAITRLLVRESVKQPLVLLVEDLQWLDSETEAFLAFLAEHVPTTRILLLLNYRPEYRLGLGQKCHQVRLRLTPLGEADARGLLSALVGDDRVLMPLKQLILEKTGGNPFFIQEAIHSLIEMKTLIGSPGNYRTEKTPGTLQIPPTVQGVLAARIDRLPAAAKALLQTLAVIGKEFPLSLVRRVCSTQRGGPPEEELRRQLSRLAEGGFIHEQSTFPELEYAFNHALTQEVAGSSLLAEQRAGVHERTAEAIEALFPGRLKDYYGELAHHYSQSGNVLKAVQYLRCAGQQAIERSATPEAIRHFGTALELLKRFPDTADRAREELSFQLLLGPVLMAARGYGAPEVEATYDRALALWEEVGETSQLFPVQLGVLIDYALHGKYAIARELGERLLCFAEDAHDEELSMEANSALATILIFQGDFAGALVKQQQALAHYRPEQHHAHAFIYGTDPGVRDLNLSAWARWYQGFPDQAGRLGQDALALAQEMSHPFSLAFSLVATAVLHQLRNEWQLVEERAESAIDLSTVQGFPFWLGWGTILRGWVWAESGRVDEGIAEMIKGLSAYRGAGAEMGCTYILGLLGSAYGRAGYIRAGLSALAKAIAMVERTGERYYEAELYRLWGELLLHQSAQLHDGMAERTAEDRFHKAIDVAHRQGARSLELRATLSLARLWQRLSRTEEALQSLTGIYSTFTEGFDSADMVEVRTMLEALSSNGIRAQPRYRH